MKINIKSGIKTYVCALLIIAATLFIFSNSLKGPVESGNDSGRVTKAVVDVIESVKGEEIKESEKEDIHHFVRKLAHFLEFAMLAFFVFTLVVFLSPKCRPYLFPYSLLYGLSVAVTDEFIQSFTGRGSAVKDVVIDFSGFITGCAFVYLLSYLVNFIKIRKNRYES